MPKETPTIPKSIGKFVHVAAQLCRNNRKNLIKQSLEIQFGFNLKSDNQSKTKQIKLF